MTSSEVRAAAQAGYERQQGKDELTLAARPALEQTSEVDVGGAERDLTSALEKSNGRRGLNASESTRERMYTVSAIPDPETTYGHSSIESSSSDKGASSR